MIAIGEIEFELNSPVEIALRKELLDNAATILSTLRGTNPQDRGMGLVSSDIIGRPVYAAKGIQSPQSFLFSCSLYPHHQSRKYPANYKDSEC